MFSFRYLIVQITREIKTESYSSMFVDDRLMRIVYECLFVGKILEKSKTAGQISIPKWHWPSELKFCDCRFIAYQSQEQCAERIRRG